MHISCFVRIYLGALGSDTKVIWSPLDHLNYFTEKCILKVYF